MVVPDRGTLIMCLRATAPALRIASGPPVALPVAAPTWPAMSPTTTTAVKWKRRPPFITLATRLMNTTFSLRSRSRTSTVSRLAMYLRGLDIAPSWLEDESAFTRRVGQRLQAAVVAEASAVEDDRCDPLIQGFLGHRQAYLRRCRALIGAVADGGDPGPQVGSGDQGMPGAVVHYLRVYVVEATENRQS